MATNRTRQALSRHNSVGSLAWPEPHETNQLVLYTTSGRNLKQPGMLARKHLQREGVLGEHHGILILGVLAVHSDMYLSELCLYIYTQLLEP